MDRRTAIKWMAAAAASMPLLRLPGLAQAAGTPAQGPAATAAQGYGTDPNLGRTYQPGELWPLTLTPAQRQTVAALCDTILPADEHSPAASAVGVPDFIDEWISAPYAGPAFPDWPFAADRDLVLGGIAWLEAESLSRFGRGFAALQANEVHAICDDICFLPRARPEFAEAAVFFSRFRDLAAGGFYTTPEGRKDLKYVGNVPLAQFDGPPPEVLKKAGLLP